GPIEGTWAHLPCVDDGEPGPSLALIGGRVAGTFESAGQTHARAACDDPCSRASCRTVPNTLREVHHSPHGRPLGGVARMARMRQNAATGMLLACNIRQIVSRSERIPFGLAQTQGSSEHWYRDASNTAFQWRGTRARDFEHRAQATQLAEEKGDDDEANT